MGPGPRGCCGEWVQNAEGARTHPVSPPYMTDKHGLVLQALGAGSGPCPPAQGQSGRWGCVSPGTASQPLGSLFLPTVRCSS